MCQLSEVSLSWMCCHVDLCLSGGSGKVLTQLSSQVEPCRALYSLHLHGPSLGPPQHPCISYLLALPGTRAHPWGGGEPNISLGLLQYLLYSRASTNGFLEPSGLQIPTSLCILAWSHHTMPFQPVSLGASRLLLSPAFQALGHSERGRPVGADPASLFLCAPCPDSAQGTAVHYLFFCFSLFLSIMFIAVLLFFDSIF